MGEAHPRVTKLDPGSVERMSGQPSSCPIPAKSTAKSIGCKNECDFGPPNIVSCLKHGLPCLGRGNNWHLILRPGSYRHTGQDYGPLQWTNSEHEAQAKPSTLPVTLNTSVEARTQLFSAFMERFFAPNVHVNTNDDSWYLLMAQFPHLASESELFERAVIALAAVYLGKRMDHACLTRHGMEIYITALKAMRRTMQQRNPPVSMLLFTSIVFHTYETIHNSDDSLQNCFNHIRGGTALMKHHSLDVLRNERLGKALSVRQKWATSFFILNTHEIWGLDWTCLRIRQEDTPIDELFAFIAEIIDFRADLAKIKGLPHAISREIREPILSHCHRLERRVRVDWMNEAAQNLDGKPSNFNMSKTVLKSRRLQSYDFKSLETAKIYLLYWLALAVIHRTIYETEKLMDQHTDSQPMLFYAGEICRSVGYCMQPQNRMSSAHAVLFGVSQASKCYIASRENDMFMLCQEIYSIVGSNGLDIALQISKEDWKLWNQGDETRHLRLRS